jgi:hypothetical protein
VAIYKNIVYICINRKKVRINKYEYIVL